MLTVSDDEFDEAVRDALGQIPRQFLDAIDNVAIVVDDEPDADNADVLGLYEGVPLTERDSMGTLMPDTITLYRGPLTRLSRTRAELRDQVAITVVHELGHYFGIDDERLDELGWG